MTEQAVNLDLRADAIRAAEQAEETRRQADRRYAEGIQRESVEAAEYLVLEVLGMGDYFREADWTPVPVRGDEPYATPRCRAETSIGDLAFRFESDEYRDGVIYLLRPCPNRQIPGGVHTAQRARFDGLAGLGELLQPRAFGVPDPWTCESCLRHEYEQAEEAERYMPQEPPPPSVAQQLENAIRSIVADELDARSAE